MQSNLFTHFHTISNFIKYMVFIYELYIYDDDEEGCVYMACKVKTIDDLEVRDIKKINKLFAKKIKFYYIFLIHYRPLIILSSSTAECNSCFNISVIYCSCLVTNLF